MAAALVVLYVVVLFVFPLMFVMYMLRWWDRR